MKRTDPFLRGGQIGIRLNGEERRIIEAAAKIADRKLSDWARINLLRVARRLVGRRAA
jgi:uncharacterized protein (DUF1778 family)